MMAYRELPDHARKQVDKYLPLVKKTEGMSRAETEKTLSQWNSENPELAMSARSLRLARKKYKERGIAGLASRRGNNSGRTIVRGEWLDYFQSLYLKEGVPSAYSCWLMTRGKFAEEDDFPVYQTFIYQLRRRVPADAIYMARHGEAAWNRKFGMYIERDYSNILCGEVWVSDHAQIDVAVADADGKPFFPWVTAWRDIKSGKWLGWLLHREPPNSDHVFQSFYYACRDFGLPRHIYIDNGKVYMCGPAHRGPFRPSIQRPSQKHRARFPEDKRKLFKTCPGLPGRTYERASGGACRRDPPANQPSWH